MDNLTAGNPVAHRVRVYYEGSNTIYEGMLLHYNHDTTTNCFVGSVSEFRTVVDGCFKPVIVLGGAKVNNLQDLFELVEKAMEAGAKGVAIGRNVWKHPDPGAVTAALVEIVHNDRSASEVGRNL